MRPRKSLRKVSVDIYHNPDDPSEVAIHLCTDDGTKLTSQAIMDAVAEALLLQMQATDEPDELDIKFDS